MEDRETAQLLSLSRVAIGAMLIVAPGRSMRGWTGETDPSPRSKMVMRGMGFRDVALGLGALIALESGAPSKWMEAGAIADTGDAIATLAAFPSLPGVKRWLWLGVSAGAAILGLQLAENLEAEEA